MAGPGAPPVGGPGGVPGSRRAPRLAPRPLRQIATCLAEPVVPDLSHLHSRQLLDVDLVFWTPQQLSMRGFETTSMAEATPRWMTGLPQYTPVAATVLSGNAEIRRPERSPFSWSSPVSAKASSTIEMNTAWFPGWEVRVDGQPVPAGPGTPSGLITFQLPAGEHLVEIQYGRTPTEKIAARIEYRVADDGSVALSHFANKK